MLKIYFFIFCCGLNFFFRVHSFWGFNISICLLLIFLLTLYEPFLRYFSILSDFSIDYISISLMMLTIWVTLLMVLSREKIYFLRKSDKYLVLLFISLLLILLLSFRTSNLLLFYFFFEASLIPTIFIIMGWGYQPERLQAGVYFLFYTLIASLPLLVLIMNLYFVRGRISFILCINNINFNHVV
jgi:NADH-ubiquinone oxidoreductase chain 4